MDKEDLLLQIVLRYRNELQKKIHDRKVKNNNHFQKNTQGNYATMKQ